MPFRNRQMRALRHLELDAFQRFGRRHAERRRKLGDGRFDAAGALDPGDQRIALLDQVFDGGAERLVGARRDRGRERAPEPALRRPGRFEQHVQAQAFDEIALRKLLQHRKARRHVGFERKLVKQPGAECVDRLHLEAAGGFQRLREQSAGPAAARRQRPSSFDFRDGAIELVVIECDPLRERREHLIGHIGGGRLGEGQAQDLRGFDTPEQQADDALRQHMGLARAGIGGDPGRRGGIGRLPLHPQDIVRDLPELGHDPFASVAAAKDHSLTRARWS